MSDFWHGVLWTLGVELVLSAVFWCIGLVYAMTGRRGMSP